MKFLQTLTICISLCLFPMFTPGTDASGFSQELSTINSSTEGKSPVQPDKEKIIEDAKRLGEEFENLFKDLTEMSKHTIEPLAANISEWIKNNYAKLTEQQRKRLAEFITSLKKEYENVEKMSLEAIKDLLDSLQEFLHEFQNDDNPDESSTRT